MSRTQLRGSPNLCPRKPHPPQPDPPRHHSTALFKLWHNPSRNPTDPPSKWHCVPFPSLQNPGPPAPARVTLSPSHLDHHHSSSFPISPKPLWPLPIHPPGTARQIFPKCAQLRTLPLMAPGRGDWGDSGGLIFTSPRATPASSSSSNRYSEKFPSLLVNPFTLQCSLQIAPLPGSPPDPLDQVRSPVTGCTLSHFDGHGCNFIFYHVQLVG